MTIEFVYDTDKLKEQTKKNVEDLVRFFSKFDYFDRHEQEAIIKEQYAYRIASVASSLNEINHCARERDSLYQLFKTNGQPNNYDDFDPRYNCFYGNDEVLTIEASINQTLIDLEQRLDIEDSPEARFILLNAVKYLAGRDVDVFELRKAKLPKWGLIDLSGLDKILGKHDTFELDYEADMAGMGIKPRFDPRKKRFIARMKKTDFEVYVLSRISQEVMNSIDGKTIHSSYHLRNINLDFKKNLNIYLRKHIKEILVPYKPIFSMISDESVEKFERFSSNSILDTLLINYALNYGKKTKLDLEFEGKGRDYFLIQINLHRRNLRINEVGNYCLSGLKDSPLIHRIKRIRIGKAGNAFMYCANLTAKILMADKLGRNALRGSDETFLNHYIDIIDVHVAGKRFMYCANLTAKILTAVDLRDYSLKGSVYKFLAHKINVIRITSTGRGFMKFADVSANKVDIMVLDVDSLSGTQNRPSIIDISNKFKIDVVYSHALQNVRWIGKSDKGKR